MERSLYIVKPEALCQCDEIKTFIEKNSKLKVIKRRRIKLTLVDFNFLFSDDVGKIYEYLAKEYLLNKEVEVCLVEGENAIEELITIIGRHHDPKCCAPNTARYIFGSRKAIEIQGFNYLLNGLHRAIKAEAATAVNWAEQIQ